MRILGHIDFRIEFSDGNHFIDVGMVRGSYNHSIELTLIDSFCYWAIYKDEHGHKKMVIFPNEEWFKDWLRPLKKKPKFLLKGGRGFLPSDKK